jgi:hypothetical protein
LCQIRVLKGGQTSITLNAMSTISLKIPKVLLNRLETEAKKTGRSKSEIIRDSLEKALGGESKDRRPTFYELTSHLAGSGKKGPSDLASNKAYLDDFGR